MGIFFSFFPFLYENYINIKLSGNFYQTILISMYLRISSSLFSLCFFQCPCVLSLYPILFLSAAMLCAFVPGSHTRNEVGSDVQPAAFPHFMSLALGN